MPLIAKRTQYFIATIVLVIVAATAWSLWEEWYIRRPSPPRHWPGFAVTLPGSYSVHGIDVSHYQGTVDWPSVKAMKDQHASLRFAFIKATEGAGYVDNNFDDNWRQCRACSLSRGAYHFFRPSQDPWLQALRFILSVQLSKGDLPPVLDAEVTEDLPPAVIRERVCCWLNTVETWYHVKPVIYTNISFYRANLKGYINEYPLWIAHYDVPYPHIEEHWQFWQYSEHGRVNGIDAAVDFNVFAGDSAAFSALLVR